MLNAAILSSRRIERFRSAGYIRFRLYLIYTFVAILFSGLGVLAYRLFPNSLPRTVYIRLAELANPGKYAKIFDFIASIIYNSVDIFKISVIIIATGFTYIAGSFCRLTLALYGISAGWSVSYLLSCVCICAVWRAVLLFFSLLYSVIVISCCVRAELAAVAFRQVGHPRVLLTSRYFWSYILWLLISFGYTLMISAVYRLCLIFIL